MDSANTTYSSYICNGKYDHDKMTLFWAVSIALIADNAICIADSKEVNSVLIYIKPKSKEAGVINYIKVGGLKMLCKMGLKSIIKLLRFDNEAHKIAKCHRTEEDGYIMGFATRIEKQGQHYGKPLIEALLRHLDTYGEGCYLETLKPENVGLYNHFSFQLKEQKTILSGNLTLFAMSRPGNK